MDTQGVPLNVGKVSAIDVNSAKDLGRAFEIVPLSDALAARAISYDLFRPDNS